MNRLMERLRRAALIYRTEGLLPLARRVCAYTAGWVFKCETYYLYENDGSAYGRRGDVDSAPEAEGLFFRVVCTNEEAGALEAQGFHFRDYIDGVRSKLDHGSIAFCIFIGHELANIGWLCTTQRAKDSLSEPPARVDFAHGEAWSGGSWTNPRYRRMGLYRYNSLKQVEYWLQKGIVKNKWAIAGRNVAPLTAESTTGNVRYGEGRLLKVLWWKSWKEKRLTAT